MVAAVFRLYLSPLDKEVSIKIQENVQILKLNLFIFLNLFLYIVYDKKYHIKKFQDALQPP